MAGDNNIHAVLTLVDINTGKEYIITPYDQRNIQASISPDGKWLAYVHSSGNETDQVYVMPFNLNNIISLTGINTDPDYTSSILISDGMNTDPTFAPQNISGTSTYMLAYIKLLNQSFDINVSYLNIDSKTANLKLGKKYQITNNSQIDTTSPIVWRD